MAFTLEGPSRFALREYPLPQVDDEGALMRVLVAGIDGTDVRYFKGEVAHRRNFPIILGDEAVGRIVAIGGGASRRWGVRTGDLVVVDAHIACEQCEECLSGRERFCAKGQGYGARMLATTPPYLWGAFSEYMYLAPGSLVRQINGLHPEVGINICSMVANGLRWVCAVGQVRPGHTVLVLGVGQQGLGCVLAAAQAGARVVIAAGRQGDEERLAAAQNLGATDTVDVSDVSLASVVQHRTEGKGADLVVDVTGSSDSLSTAIESTRVGGRVVVAGLSSRASTVRGDDLVWREISLLGVYSHDATAVDGAVTLARKCADQLRALVSHRFPLEGTVDAISAVDGGILPRPVKVIIVPDTTFD